MEVGQNIHFNDRNMWKLPFFKFFYKIPEFPKKLQFWFNFNEITTSYLSIGKKLDLYQILVSRY